MQILSEIKSTRNRTPQVWSYIGIPDHVGVIHVGGRIGAASGPEAFERAFNRLKGKYPIKERLQGWKRMSGVTNHIEENHKKAIETVASHHKPTGLSVVVGGGHDHGFTHLKGLQEAYADSKDFRLGCINIDAHLDVRPPTPLITSGSPFYMALESQLLHPKRFVEFGIQDHCNGPELFKYVSNKGVTVVPWSTLRQGRGPKQFKKSLVALASRSSHVAISLDLDAAANAYSPGVSAPQSEGFTASDLIEIAEIAGKNPKVVSLGIFELNPEHDIDHCTARLAATVAHHFLTSALYLR